MKLEDPVRYVPWSSVNPYPDDKDREMTEFPWYFSGPKPFQVTVKAGQLLYLPSMWFHHVSQSPDSRGLTIAVNYWYDMQFDIKYAYFNFLQSIHYTLPKNSMSLASHVKLCSNETKTRKEEADIIASVETGEAEVRTYCIKEV